jgi:hypothetical protein
MLRDNLVGLIEPMPTPREKSGSSLALGIPKQRQVSDDRSSCLENPRPEGAESALTERLLLHFRLNQDILKYQSLVARIGVVDHTSRNPQHGTAILTDGEKRRATGTGFTSSQRRRNKRIACSVWRCTGRCSKIILVQLPSLRYADVA